VRAIAPLFLDEKSQRFLFPFISGKDKKREKVLVLNRKNLKKSQKYKPGLLFTNNGSFFINNFSKNHRIFATENANERNESLLSNCQVQLFFAIEKITITNRIILT